MYTVVDAVLLEPLRLPEAHRMFVLRQENHELALMPGLTASELDEIVEAANAFGTAGPYTEWSVTLRYDDSVATEMVQFASEGATRALGVQPQIGRWPSDEEHRSGAPVAVITDRVWRRHGADPAVLGRPIRLRTRGPSGFADVDFTIIGVAPPSLRGRVVGIPYAAVLPFRSVEAISPGGVTKASVFWVGMLGRLSPGLSMQEAARRVAGWQLAPWGPRAVPRRVELLPATDAALSEERRAPLERALGWLSALAGVVLLLGCANLASAMIARSVARGPEIAMRISLGASRSRLVRLLAVEYLLIGLMSVAAALAASQVMVRAFPAALALGRRWVVVPVEVPLDLTASVVTVAGVLGIASCLLCGLAPAVRYARIDPMTALRGSAQARHTARERPRRLLLGLQVATSSLLLVAAFLLRAAVAEGASADHGFGQNGVLVYARVQLRGDDATITRVRQRILERLGTHPSFVGAAFTSSPEPFAPLGAGDRIEAEGEERVPVSRELARNMTGGRVLAEHVDATFRETVGLPLLSGRDLRPLDAAGREPGVLVNEDLARQFWPAGAAVGGRIRVHLFGSGWVPASSPARIVGVVGNARSSPSSHGPEPLPSRSASSASTASSATRWRGERRRSPFGWRSALRSPSS